MPSELVFCGTNRKKALQKLIDVFDEVSSEVYRDQNTPESRAQQRVVLVHAERGLGKTRLAMEFFKYLSKERDPDHYWPDEYLREADSVEVMPASENCSHTKQPAFLWWGMKVADGPNPGNTVFNSLEDLLPHLMSARLATRRAKSGKEFKDDALDLAVDLSLEVAEIGVELAGLGVIKRLGQSGLKIGKIIHRHATQKDDALSDSREQLDSVVDAVLDDLSRLFSPASKQFAKIPLVVLVDDAQFADKDIAMATFLEKLIARSTNENWPILLLITHWSRQLSFWVDGEDRRQLPSKISRVLIHAVEKRVEELGEFASQPGGSLNSGQRIDIDLSEPVDDLSEALERALPGIEDGDVAALVSKSGGNPRKLEQLLAWVSRKPRFFEGNSLAGALTEGGREAILTKADLPIEEVVLERFADTPAEVRRALMMASMLGPKFVVDLVERLAKARLQPNVRDPLKAGERTYRFVQDVVDRSRNDIAVFTERLFFDAANEYRESGLAKSEIPEWPEDQELFLALDTILEELVEDPNQFEDLSDDDLFEALSIAKTRMLDGDSELAVLACARLVDVEGNRGNYEGAVSAAWFLEYNFSSSRSSLQKIPTDLLYIVVQALEIGGGRAEVDRYLEVAVDRELPLLENDASNGPKLSRLANACRSLGYGARKRADYSLAHSRYKDELLVYQRLAKVEPSHFRLQNGLAGCFKNLAEVSNRLGEAKEAKSWYEKALSVLVSQAEDSSSESGPCIEVIDCLIGLGIATMATGEIEAAQTRFERARHLQNAYIELDSSFEQIAKLAKISTLLGENLRVQGKVDEAQKHFLASIEVLEQLVADESKSRRTLVRLNLADCYLRVGDCFSVLAKPENSVIWYKKALQALETPSELSGYFAHTKLRDSIESNYVRLGTALQKLNCLVEAQACYQGALKVIKAIETEELFNAKHQYSLARCHFALGDVLSARGQGKNALNEYGEAKRIVRELLKDNDLSPKLTRTLQRLAFRYRDRGSN